MFHRWRSGRPQNTANKYIREAKENYFQVSDSDAVKYHVIKYKQINKTPYLLKMTED
jgi:hypothetical protein